MDLDRLRSETRVEHESTEGAMPLMNAGLTLAVYGDVMRRLYPVVRGWEEWAIAHAPEDLAAELSERQRAPLIEQDLRALGVGGLYGECAFPAHAIPGLEKGGAAFRSSFLGAMYVMEGSTLGGQYIARHVEEALGLREGEGDAYFRGYASKTGEMWRRFKGILAEVDDAEAEVVIAAAKGMFGVFRAGMTEG